MLRALRWCVPTLGLVFSLFLIVKAADVPVPEQRAKAKALFEAGNFREAYDISRQLALSPHATGIDPADDLEQAVLALQRLQRLGEIDALLNEAVELHAQNWQVLWRAGKVMQQIPHFGSLTAGEFSRGNQNGGGEWIDVTERDRVQSLIWLNQARRMVPDDASVVDRVALMNNLADALKQGRDWKLQILTDLTTLPDYTAAESAGRGRRFGWGGARPQGAPVNEEGNPVYYSVPDSFETARNDGERWRWCLKQVAVFDPAKADQVRLTFANFLQQQFGVQTLAQWGIYLPRGGDDSTGTQGALWSLPELPEDETIARLATGVKRFKLPDEFNYIRIYRELAAGDVKSTVPFQALQQLAQIFENRQQYDKAVECWEAAAKQPLYALSLSKQFNVRNRINQITGHWGQFEPVMSQPAGSGATVDYRFRNGNSVSFEAFPIKVPELLADIKAYLKSRPQQLDWEKIQVEQIGLRIVQKNERKYLGAKVADWSLTLEPRPGHFDRRVTVTTPLQKGGAYLVTAKMADGNTSRIILWLNDTAIVKKQLNGKSLYYVADAVSGAPANHAKVDFFGWKQDYDANRRRSNTTFSETSEFTNADGMIVTDPRLLPETYQWMAVARTESGGFAHLGFSGVWYQDLSDPTYRDTKVYVITDRPVYRPDQTVQFKIWVREVGYDKDKEDGTRFAGKTFHVKVVDPQGTEVLSKELTADEFGGLSGDYLLPQQAMLGEYQLVLNGERVSGSNGFRVEEYKKPEFEVTIDAPKEPVQLGDNITATITAKYYYGAPVAKGTVKFKVERSQHDARWFPVDPWDWLYGNGYWWFTPDTDWYPGFVKWGCIAPRPFWMPWSADPPELVLDQEVPVGPDGTVKVEINTALAKLLHGDQDHQYTITAEVTDASRRTIVGTGKVLVSREPFRIFSWTNRGYYHVGDTIDANFQARTLDGNGVKGTGTLKLLKVRYENGQPVEEAVQEWSLDTDDDGFTKQTLKASQPGQYRLSFSLKSAPDAPAMEGGQLFLIRGEGFDGSEFRFNDLEVIANQKTYQPGEKVKLLINTNRIGSTVLLFVRPVDGVAPTIPQLLRISGKSTEVEIDVEQKDMPNFFVEAVTVADGKLHDQARELVVPPESRVLNVEVKPSAEQYLPGGKAGVEVKVTGPDGKPVQGSVVLSVYDRAVEYISGGSNVEDMKEFFWKWRRHYQPQAESNLAQWFHQLLNQNEPPMLDLGVFGGSVADRDQRSGAVAGTPTGAPGRMMFSRAMPSAAPMAESMMADGMALQKGGAAPGSGGGGEEMVAPTVRTNFADTAFWKADLLTDASGLAHVTFDMPENLSAWKLRAWGMGSGTNVGEGTAEAVTRKNIIVRLQAPRFFVETDEVMISANVHNDLDVEKKVRVELTLDGNTLGWLADFRGTPRNFMSSDVTIPAHGETRVDWRVKAINPGTATLTVKALTNEESDAMQMAFPVNVHGILKTESFSRVIRPDASTTTIEFTVPEQRIPEQSRLEVRYSPTLAGAMVDALPYLVDYPYGCTEQTLNRFLPTVITQKILLEMGLDLKAIQEKRTNLNAQQIGDDAQRAKQWKRFDRNPVFDTDEVAGMVKKGIQDLSAMQNSDGGWGWFSGWGEHSWPHTTAVVVHGLQIAQHNDVALIDGLLKNGRVWLKRHQTEQVELLLEGERHAKDSERKGKYKLAATDTDALIFAVLVEGGIHDSNMQRFLYRDRLSLAVYSQALLGLALHELMATEQRDMVVRNLDQFLKVDDENQTAYLDLPGSNPWWYWYGDPIEANAWYLKLLTKVNPSDPKAAGLVKYLINNRRHGTYWKSTRDTAYSIEALADYLAATKEMQPNVQVEVWLDGERKQTVDITPPTLFSFDNSFVVEGKTLTAGPHTLELRRRPLGIVPSPATSLYVNAYVTNFTKEDPITAAGLEIKIGRKFYKLIQDKSATTTVPGSRGQALDQSVVKYNRTELKSLDEVVSGDLIEIELEIDSKNDYEYVIVEDFKAAGCEPVDLQSGYTRGGLGAYVEFRDEKVAFFLRQLSRGKHSVSYRLRSEIPGKFSALPAAAHAMYAPELKANSNEMKLRIDDRP